MTTQPLKFTINIPASRSEVWQTWTTKEGITCFFAPDCLIELKPGGSYEMYFDLEAEVGKRGGEGCQVLAIEDQRMLSFSWNAPPEFPEVRKQQTHVIIRLFEMAENQTRVELIHDGWGEGLEWQEVRRYFSRAWGEVVFPRLLKRFTAGPIQWENLSL